MTDDTLLEYRITNDHEKFVAIDSVDEVVGVFDTEREAACEIERAKLEDAIYKHSKILFHAAIASAMNSFDVDRNTARCWIATAAEQILLEITKDGIALVTGATVASFLEGKGMGVVFRDMAPEHIAVLASWLKKAIPTMRRNARDEKTAM
jgi:hypothetical protein